MKYLFYNEFYQKRLNRIVRLFGKHWFADKTVLELGAAHGDIGIELLKLGADVTFSDIRHHLLEDIRTRLVPYYYNPKLLQIDQNTEYSLPTTYDLVLHLGILYNIENWKTDLKCALNHTKLMILETVVNPVANVDQCFEISNSNEYGNTNCKSVMLCQESIENELKTLDCKFIRFDDPELNCNWAWVDNQNKLRHIYDWTYDTIDTRQITGYNTHYRRFWLVFK